MQASYLRAFPKPSPGQCASIPCTKCAPEVIAWSRCEVRCTFAICTTYLCAGVSCLDLVVQRECDCPDTNGAAPRAQWMITQIKKWRPPGGPWRRKNSCTSVDCVYADLSAGTLPCSTVHSMMIPQHFPCTTVQQQHLSCSTSLYTTLILQLKWTEYMRIACKTMLRHARFPTMHHHSA